MHTITKKFLAAGSMLLGLQAAAQAGPILVVTNGILTGAQGVELNGRQYDVAFSDVRPVADTLAFDSLSAALEASSALDQLVFGGVYDTNPGRTNGCSNPLLCFVVTAFDVSSAHVTGAAFTNTTSPYIDLLLPYAVIGNAAKYSITTYAHWSVQDAGRQSVPEPSTLLLTGAGLAAFLLRRKARSASTVA